MPAVRRPSTFRVAEALFAVLGRPVLARALATFLAVGFPSAIVFSPSGMRASDLVRGMHHSLGLRSALWVGWLFLAAPASRAAFDARGTLMIRALRPARAILLVTLLLLLALCHLPWALLFARGGGLLEAAGAVGISVAIETAALAGARRRHWLWLAALGAVLVGFDPPALLSALVGIVLAGVGVHAAWRTAPEQASSAWRLTRPTHPLLALTAMHLLRIMRAERSRLTLATMIASFGGAGLLSLRSEPTAHPISRALAIMALPAVFTTALFVGPLLECEGSVRMLLRSLRVRQATIAFAFLLALATPATALAASAGVVASSFAKLEPSAFTTTLGGWSFALAMSVGAWGRRHQRTSRKSPVVFAVGVILIAGGALAMVTAW